MRRVKQKGGEAAMACVSAARWGAGPTPRPPPTRRRDRPARRPGPGTARRRFRPDARRTGQWRRWDGDLSRARQRDKRAANRPILDTSGRPSHHAAPPARNAHRCRRSAGITRPGNIANPYPKGNVYQNSCRVTYIHQIHGRYISYVYQRLKDRKVRINARSRRS